MFRRDTETNARDGRAPRKKSGRSEGFSKNVLPGRLRQTDWQPVLPNPKIIEFMPTIANKRTAFRKLHPPSPRLRRGERERLL
jgi:hypothetical protein